MCDCIARIDADLKPNGQCLDATMFGERKATTILIRTDKWVPEKRRGKPARIIATYCPFCGVKYSGSDDLEKAAALAPAQCNSPTASSPAGSALSQRLPE